MSNLKGIASKLKHLEKATGVDKQERLIEEVCEIIRQHELINPGFMQREYWPLVELTHDEIRSMGKGEKVLEDFRSRWKISLQEWYDRRSEWKDSEYLHEIARFCDFVGDPCPDWWPRRKAETVTTNTSEIPQ
jgi:hypothetical protein